jgi:DNA-binding CsgD family transcriptional regulator
MASELFGRSGELSVLTKGLSEARSGARLCLLEGPGGVGKTAILDTLAKQVAQLPDCEVIRVRGSRSNSIPLFDLVEAFDVRGPDQLPHASDGWQIGVNVQTSWHESLFVEIERRAGSGMLVSLLVDDVHLLDPSSCGFLASCPRVLAGVPILIVAASRPVTPGHTQNRRIRDEAHDLIELGGLELDDMLRIAQRELGASAMSTSLAQSIEQANGRPLLAREIARASKRRRETVQFLGDRSVSVPYEALLAAELRGLTDDERTIVHMAAVLGFVNARELGVMSGLRQIQIFGALRSACAAGILTPEPDASFVHDVVRELVLAQIQSTERMALHRDAAEMLQRLDPEAHGNRIVTHLSETGELRGKALDEWLTRIAADYRTRSPAAAIAPLTQICESAPSRSETWNRASVMLVEVLAASGQLELAEVQGRLLLESLTDDSLKIELSWWLGCILFLRNRATEGAALLYAASSQPTDDRTHARLVAMSALSSLVGLAPRLNELAVESMSNEAGRADPIARTLERIVMARHYAQQLDLNATSKAMSEALTIANNDTAAARFQPYVFNCFASDERREFEATLRLAATGRSRSNALGTPWAEAFYDSASANASLHLGAIDDCAVFSESSLAASREHGVMTTFTYACALAAIAAVHLGRLHDAQLLIADGHAEIDRSGTLGHGVCELSLAEGLLMFARGDQRGGYTYLLDSLEFLSSIAPMVAESLLPDLMFMGTQLHDVTWTGPTMFLLARTEAAWSTPFRRVGQLVARHVAVHGETTSDSETMGALVDAVPETYARVALLHVLSGLSGASSALRTRTARSIGRLSLLWSTYPDASHPVTGPKKAGRPLKTVLIGWESLTSTERLVAHHLAIGDSNREIARILGISLRTVETHMGSIRRKLQTMTRVATAIAIRSRSMPA